MIAKIIDYWFRFFMWMLLDSSGRTFFWVSDTILLITCLWFLWFTKDEKE